MRPLILIGGGGHCKSVIEVAESAGFSIKGVLDVEQNVGKSVLNYPILGTDANISDYIDECDFVITVGFIKSPNKRIELYNKVKSLGGHLPTIIAKTAYVSQYSSIGEGTVIHHYAFINASVQVGRACIINTMCNLGHDVSVGDYCHISTGVMACGDCNIGDGVFIGSQSVLVNGISIADNCVIGSGSNVTKTIVRPGLYYGNPATLRCGD